MLEIRTGTPGDVNALAAVEKECFPPAEAATKEILQKRLACYGNHFWLNKRREAHFFCRRHGDG